MKRRGFTLLELIIVVIIIGVLATLGFGAYQRAVEKARGAEARAILGNIRTQAAAYRMQYGNLTPGGGVPNFGNMQAGIGLAATDPSLIPNVCVTTHYFRYNVASVAADTLNLSAARCTSGGKSPNAPASMTNATLNLSVYFSNGTDLWTGSY